MALTHFTTTDEVLELGLGAGSTKAFVYDNGGAPVGGLQEVQNYLYANGLKPSTVAFVGALGHVGTTKILGHHTTISGAVRGAAVLLKP